MKGRYTCFKCGLAGYTTWEGDNTSKPTVICKTCRLAKKKVVGDHSLHNVIARAQSFEIKSQLQCIVSPNETSINQSSIQIQDQGIETKFAHKGKSACLWDPRISHKRRRSKLPQYVSPMERFANQMCQAKMCHDKEDVFENNGIRWLTREKQKYDDNFIYEKCKLIPENEIGLGATLLAPSIPLKKFSRPVMGKAKTEPYSDGDYASSVLFDVPISGFYA